MSHIQFTYPMMSGTLDQGNFIILDDGGGYFQCNYATTTTPPSDVYKLFKPKNILFLLDSMIITHTYNNDTLYVKYSTIQDSTRYAITADNIYLNKLIGDGIVINKTVDFTDKTCVLLSDATKYYIDMTTIGKIPVNIKPVSTAASPFPTTAPPTIATIPLSSGSFITDEIVCDSGNSNSDASTNSSTSSNSKKYTGEVFTMIGIAIAVLFVQFLALYNLQKIIPNFPSASGIFGFASASISAPLQIIYMICTYVLLLASASFFIIYGYKMNSNNIKEIQTASDYSGKYSSSYVEKYTSIKDLGIGIILLLMFIMNIVFKSTYLMESPL